MEKIQPTQEHRFDRAFKKLLRNNLVAFGLSAFNEVVIGHSALGFSQASMELTDATMAVGLKPTERLDIKGQHERASKWRKRLYKFHIGVAAVGMVEATRLMREGAAPSLGNIAVSAMVGGMNAHYIHHELKHRHNEAHKRPPDMTMAFEDPIEVIQDERMGYPDAQTLYELNHNGTIAIAKTNAVEAGGGLIGSLSQFGWEQGGAVMALASSAGVIALMGQQIQRERHNFRSYQNDMPVGGAQATAA